MRQQGAYADLFSHHESAANSVLKETSANTASLMV
jgi:hypothetical protein